KCLGPVVEFQIGVTHLDIRVVVVGFELIRFSQVLESLVVFAEVVVSVTGVERSALIIVVVFQAFSVSGGCVLIIGRSIIVSITEANVSAAVLGVERNS